MAVLSIQLTIIFIGEQHEKNVGGHPQSILDLASCYIKIRSGNSSASQSRNDRVQRSQLLEAQDHGQESWELWLKTSGEPEMYLPLV